MPSQKSVKKQRFEISRNALGSRISAVIADTSLSRGSAEAALSRCMDECNRIEKAFSRFLPDSELSRLNTRLNEWTTVSEELFLLLRYGEELRLATKGAFDVTVKSILEGWGYDKTYSLTEKTNAGVLGSVSFREPNKVRLSAEADLGGIGKGYALDRMKLFLADFENILLDAGGDLYARGKDANGEGWRVLFEHPTDIKQAIGEVVADDLFLAASSPSRRAWRHFHHLVDPATLQPARETQIVFVQAKKGMIADGLATALFVMGAKKAAQLLPSLPAEAMLIDGLGKIYKTPAFQGKLFTG